MRVATRVPNGRHRPTSRLPLGRLMAAMMLASLISTLFAIPASAAAGDLDFNVVSSAPSVLPGGTYTYTVTLTNNSGADATTVSFDVDTIGGSVVGTMNSATPSAGGLCSAPSGNASTCTFATVANTTSASVTINVTAPAGIGTVTATVSTFSDFEAGSATGTLLVSTVVENADLQITKTHAPLTVAPGTAFTYTIAVKNNGPSDALNVSMSDTAPANITFGTVSIASTDAVARTCGTTTGTQITCAGWTIPNGVTVTLTVNATLALASVGPVANTATVSSTTLDAVAANNTSTDTLTPASIDLAVSLAANPTTASPGSTVTFAVGVQNISATDDATSVIVTDTIPAGLTANSTLTQPSVGTLALAGNVLTWTIPTLTKGTTVTATFDVTIDVGTALTTVDDSASVLGAQTDPVLANNTATVTITITPAVADLDLLTAVDNAKPNKGDKIAIAVQVTNAGPDDATNVVIKDVLANGLQYDSCSPCSPSGIRRSSSNVFSIASIPANTAATLILNVTVTASSGTLKSTASIVSADQSDPNGSNDADTVQITVGGTNNSGGGGSGSGTSGSSGSGSTAFTGFTANQLLPWLMLFGSLGLVALEFARRRPAVAAIGHTYGFDPWV